MVPCCDHSRSRLVCRCSLSISPRHLAIVTRIPHVGANCAYLTEHRYRNFSRPHPRSVSGSLPAARAPHVTIIRPVKGVEPFLSECLQSTFELSYPHEKLSIALCVSSASDPALPLLKETVKKYPEVDGRIYVEEHDSVQDGTAKDLGPNPKIRNMSQAYREARGDIVWILDCNVWVHKDTAGLLVDLLCGLGADQRKYKFVHHLPLAVDTSHIRLDSSGSPTGKTVAQGRPAGGLLEEMFLSTAHAKFYTAIATAAVAPCTNGKSTMFRRTHLNALTPPSPAHVGRRFSGIEFFSDCICEDHLISDMLWRSPVPVPVRDAAALEGRDPEPSSATDAAATAVRWGNHALLLAPPCVQPVHRVPVRAYAARRARWLRVRKFTVPSATAVEPGTESLVATTMGAAGLAALLPPTTRWFAAALWVGGVAAWMCVDRWVWVLLQRRLTSDAMDGGPTFADRAGGRHWGEWLWNWAGREVLALPIWVWAIFGGTEVVWRGQRFWVGMDKKVHELGATKKDA